MGKIAIVGAGFVGATAAYASLIKNVANEIALIDIQGEKAQGEAMDLGHGLQFVTGTKISYCDRFEDCGRADIVVVTAGAAQKPGESRLDLVSKNVAIFKEMIPGIAETAPDSVLMIVTNPVDIMTYFAHKYSGFPAQRVFGTGTTLDTARFRYLLGRRLAVSPTSVHAYIIGEHGDSEFPVWSSATVGGVNLKNIDGWDRAAMDDIFAQTKNAAYEIISRKGATYYAIGLAVAQLCDAILKDKNEVFPVSVPLDDYYGESDVCLSVPAVLGAGGVKRIIYPELDAGEQAALHTSASVLKSIIEKLA